MTASGATMQNYLTDLIQNLESMRLDRQEIQEEIGEFEKNKNDIESNILALSTRLNELNQSLGKKRGLKLEYVNNITEISTAFSKILESSQTLLHVAKKESSTLEKKKDKIMSEDPLSATPMKSEDGQEDSFRGGE
jgi:Sjoegren syndrome nuclear autoantigen 1